MHTKIRFLVCAVAILYASAGDASAQHTSPLKNKRLIELNALTGEKAVEAKYRELIQNKKRAKRLVDSAVKAIQKDKEALRYNAALVLAKAAGELKRFDDSERLYRICMNNAAKLQSKRKLLESYGGLIDVYFDNRMYKKSAKICLELLELQTDDGTPREVYFLREKDDGDVTFQVRLRFDTAQFLEPIVKPMLIQSISKQGDFEDALRMVEKMLEENDTWYQRQLKGWVLREAGKYKEAAEVYEDVLERLKNDMRLDKSNREYYTDRYRYILSNVYVDMNKIEKAAEQLQALVDAHPDNPGYHNDLGYILANHDMQLKRAEKLIRKALKLDREQRKNNPNLSPAEDRDNGAYLDSMGWVLFKLKRYKEAKKYLQAAVEDPRAQHIEIYDHLGDVYMVLGETKAAIEAWQKGVDVAGNSRKEREIKDSVLKKIERAKSK